MNWFVVFSGLLYPSTFLYIPSINFWEFDIETPIKILIYLKIIIIIVVVVVWSPSRVQLCNPIDCSLPGSSVEFSGQEYWSVLPFSSPGGLPDPGIKPWSPVLQVDSLLLNYQGSPNILWLLLLLSRFSHVQLSETL